MGPLSWGNAPQMLALGVILFLALYEIFPVRGVKRPKMRWWAIGFDAIAAFFIIGRLIQRAAVDPELALLGIRLQLATPYLLGVFGIGFVHASLVLRIPKRHLIALAAISVALFVPTLFTDLAAAGPMQLEADVLGNPIWKAVASPWALLLAAYMVIVGVWGVRTVRRSPEEKASGMLLFASGCFALLAINDLLNFAGVVNTLPMAELGFVLTAAGATYVELTRIARSHASLEEEVADRTAQLMRHQAELLRADRLASVGTLAAGTAHEINNPLTYVTTNLTLLEEELGAMKRHLPPGGLTELRELILEAQQGCERVRRIVRDLKALSRSTPEEERRPVDVSRVLESSLKIAYNEIRHRARLAREVRDASPVMADASRLGQVFLNLLVNAAQAIPEGHADENVIRVTVGEEGQHVVIEVSDTGAGIPEELHERLFDPFFTTKQAGEGTGLGLSICHGIVTSFGGRMDVQSAPGRGSTFRVELPIATESDQLLAESRLTSSPPVTPSVGARVLIVDDEPRVARALGRALREHSVSVVHSGREALERCRNESFEVVLCDLMMPELTGMEVHARLMEQDPALAARTIFVTGGAFTAAARTFLSSVPNTRLEKPVDVEELRAVVAKTVRDAGR